MASPSRKLPELEIDAVRAMILESGGLISTVAKRLGLSVSALNKWLDTHPALREELAVVRADVAEKTRFKPDPEELRNAILAYDGNLARIGKHFGFNGDTVAAYLKQHPDLEKLVEDTRQLIAQQHQRAIFAPDTALVLDAIDALRGNVGGVAMRFHVSRNTMLNYINARPELQAAVYEAHEKTLDMVETTLENRALAGDAWAVCCAEGTLVTMADGSQQPIETITAGSFVISHRGAVRMVQGVSARKYDGAVIEIEVSGLPRKLVVTPEHPIYARLRRGPQLTKRCQPLQETDFTPAGVIQIGDLLHTPFLNYEQSQFSIDEETAFILGIYAAEGRAFKLDQPKQSWQMKPKVIMRRTQGERGGCVEFSLNTQRDAKLKAAIERYAEKLDGAAVYIRPHSQTDQCEMVILSHRPFANFCANHVGVGSKNKSLSSELMSASVVAQKAFLAGYLRGDGSISARNDGSKAASITATTASRNLAYQLLLMLARVGVIGTLKKGMNNGGPDNRAPKNPKWSLYIRPRECMKLSALLDYDFAPRDNKPGSRIALSDGIYGRVRSVLSRAYHGLVYNLQVADDESYLAELCSVHNCFYLKTQGRKRGYIERGETFNMNIQLDRLSLDQLERLAAGEHPSLVLGATAADNRSRARSQTIDALAVTSASDLGAEEEAG